jgi:hypothetical protein
MKIILLLILIQSTSVFAINVEYSDDILSMHEQYNSTELEDIAELVEVYLMDNCTGISGEYTIVYTSGSVDLFVSWDKWKVLSFDNKSVLDIDVTLWQAPGSYKLEQFSKLNCNVK